MRKSNGRNGRSHDLLGNMIKGAVAGAIGTWVMDRVTWELYLTEDPKAFEQEKEAQFEGKYGAHVAADKVEQKTGMDGESGVGAIIQHRGQLWLGLHAPRAARSSRRRSVSTSTFGRSTRASSRMPEVRTQGRDSKVGGPSPRTG